MDNRNNRNNGTSEFFSWFIIALLFAGGGWPIALFLLFRKKARSVCLFVCKRTPGGKLSLSPFCECACGA